MPYMLYLSAFYESEIRHPAHIRTIKIKNLSYSQAIPIVNLQNPASKWASNEIHVQDDIVTPIWFLLSMGMTFELA